MKKFKFLALILFGFIAIATSGMVDSYLFFEVPSYIRPMDGLTLSMAGLAVSDIVTEYGAYYEKGNQNASRLLKLLMQPTVTENYMTAVKTDDTIFKLANGVIDDIVQPFQKAFTPKGTVTFKPQPIELHHIKVDFSMYPDDIEATWLGFLASSDLKRTDWPIVRYAWEQYLINKIKDNMELKEIYKGVYEAPVPGAAGATGKSMNGIAFKLALGVEDHTINSIALDPFTASNAFDQVEEFVDGIADLYQGIKMFVFSDPTIFKYYMRDKRASGFYQKFSEKDLDNGIDFTPQSVLPLPSMAGTGEIFCTPKENLLHITKKDVNKTRYELQGVDRQVKFLTDWWEGVGFGINEAVWTNKVPQV